MNEYDFRPLELSIKRILENNSRGVSPKEVQAAVRHATRQGTWAKEILEGFRSIGLAIRRRGRYFKVSNV